MRRTLLAATCFLAMAGGMAGQANATAYTFTTISDPNAVPGPAGVATVASGINDLGQIVGSSYPAYPPGSALYGSTTGFLDTAGAFTAVNDPAFANQLGTIPRSINNKGQIAGFSGAGGTGFFYSNGVYTSTNSTGSSINDSGVVLGQEPFVSFSNVLYSNGIYTNFVIPGFPLIGAAAMNNSGQVVGQLYKSNATGTGSVAAGGFLYSGGVITPIDVPNAFSTIVTAISNSGEVAGNADGNGFVYDNGTYSIVNAGVAVPGALGTTVYGINDAGVVVGVYGTYSSGSHAFYATPAPVPEPASAALLGMGVLGLGFAARRRGA